MGAYHTVILKDLESDWVNRGMYRMALHDVRTLGMMILPNVHSGEIFRRYKALKKPMPMCAAISQDPVHRRLCRDRGS